MRTCNSTISRAQSIVSVIYLILLVMADAAAKKTYFIRTKENTPLETFQSWIQELDNGQGTQIVHDHVYNQAYVTNLTPDEANQVQQKDFILFVFEQGEPQKVNLTRAVPLPRSVDQDLFSPAQSNGKPRFDRRFLETVGSLIDQKKFISWNKPGRPPINAQYVSDNNDGEGVDIYFFDTGINLNVEVPFPFPILKDQFVK